jgi:hypothetical protein
MERTGGLEPLVSALATPCSAFELCPQNGGPTENRTQRGDLARITCTPVPGPKTRRTRGDGCLLSRRDRLKPARPNSSARVGFEPTRLQVGPLQKTAMKNPARACARRGSVNLSVDAGTLYPAESPSLLPCRAPNLCSGRDWRAQYQGRVANSMAAVLTKHMFSLCVMARDINVWRGTCNPYRAKFFASGGRYRCGPRLCRSLPRRPARLSWDRPGAPDEPWREATQLSALQAGSGPTGAHARDGPARPDGDEPAHEWRGKSTGPAPERVIGVPVDLTLICASVTDGHHRRTQAISYRT